MIMMGPLRFIQRLCILFVIFLSPQVVNAQVKLEVPPCPSETKRYYGPDAGNPLWTGCKDSKGFYQGILVQFSNQKEVIRIASVRNSQRNGKEIRFGRPSTFEERNFQDGHLHGSSYIFKSNSPLGRILPTKISAADWIKFSDSNSSSLLKEWLKTEPLSEMQFKNGRITEVKFEKKHYHFELLPDGRIFAKDHPEIKGTPLIDPEPILALDADDLKKLLVPGFGSCKKYAGPLGRFQRNYAALLYRREPNEKKHLEKLEKMQDRFMEFCFPQDLKVALGELECSPALPSDRPSRKCSLAFSDQLKIPYNPKYFKFTFTLKKSPEAFVAYLNQIGLQQFMSNNLKDYDLLKGTDGINIEVKKTTRGTLYRVVDKERKEDVSKRAENWWDWHVIPNF